MGSARLSLNKLSLRRSAANEPNDNASTRDQPQRLKFEKDRKRHRNKRKDSFKMKSNKRISPTRKIEGVIAVTALPPGEY